MIKSGKAVYIVTKIYVKQMLFFSTFCSSKNPEQIHSLYKLLSSTTVLSIDKNKKGFLSTKSAYYNDF